ncbi:substrate-binding domain-containing protein [Methylotuvimicrobium alcaliphilum]|uniref:substrate-binding domain-containing protein n=1 Tax=Methylotuvimicrobium alcaliphilum TaxID=271065 RepID=UPI0003200EA5|nr:substrate-binding domain-containing protein [Methylotuvimicrobium alcaliphilum]
MKSNESNKNLRRKQFGFLVLLFVLMSQVLSAPTPSIYPVVNSALTQNSVSRNGLSAIFRMRLRQWQDGSPITVFVLRDNNPLHQQFCKQVLNVFPHQMRRSWNKLVFSGTGQAPVTVASKEEMVDKIASTPGAIGYLSDEDITEDIKILIIK